MVVVARIAEVVVEQEMVVVAQRMVVEGLAVSVLQAMDHLFQMTAAVLAVVASPLLVLEVVVSGQSFVEVDHLDQRIAALEA